jgi:hypothetical protein
MSEMLASTFLIPLAQQINRDNPPVCRRAVARVLSLVAVKFESGIYDSELEAEHDFRRLAELACEKTLTEWGGS